MGVPFDMRGTSDARFICRHPVRPVSALRQRMLEDMAMARPAIRYGAGLRESEVASLKVDDIDSTRMLIRVEQGKGRKDRNAMLSPQQLALLRLWWKEGKRRSVMLPHGWLFPGRSATDPISTRQINSAIHEAAEAAGIRKRVPPHTLRHSKLDTTALYARVATKTSPGWLFPASTGSICSSTPAALR